MIDRRRVQTLLNDGISIAEIARTLNCHPNTIHKVRKELQEGGGVATEEPSTASTGGTPGTPVPASLKGDPDLLAAQREIVKLELEARRLEAEERLARIRRQSEPTVNAGNGNGEMAQLLRLEFQNRFERLERDRAAPANQMGSFVPLIQTFLQSLMDLLGRLVAKTQEKPKELDLAALQAMVAPQADSLGSIIPLIKQVLELATEIGGGGGGGGSDMAQIITALAPVLSTVQQGGAAPGFLPQPAQPGAAKQPGQGFRDPMVIRIATFLLAIEREARARTDPWAVAEAIERDLGLCPEAFRKLFLENGPEQIMAGLARFVPEPIHARVTGLMAQNAQARAWFVEFVQAIQGSGEEETEEQPAPEFEIDGDVEMQDGPEVPATHAPEPAAAAPPPSPI